MGPLRFFHVVYTQFASTLFRLTSAGPMGLICEVKKILLPRNQFRLRNPFLSKRFCFPDTCKKLQGPMVHNKLYCRAVRPKKFFVDPLSPLKLGPLKIFINERNWELQSVKILRPVVSPFMFNLGQCKNRLVHRPIQFGPSSNKLCKNLHGPLVQNKLYSIIVELI